MNSKIFSKSMIFVYTKTKDTYSDEKFVYID